MQWEFEVVKDYLTGNGVDVGCGTNRISPEILSIDQQPNKKYAHADIVHDCHDLEIEENKEWNEFNYTFEDNTLDFIFSSHCLEDFEDIETVYMNWWKKLKPNGYMLLLLPDMEACSCEYCQSEPAQKARAKEKRSARYWTIEDYEQHHAGNPSHKTNVGKSYIIRMLDSLDLKYKLIQCDTLPHDKTCTIDFVIQKIEEAENV
jgi:predicted SAM-dependent methyltransferase